MDNPFIESFNGRLRDEHLNTELFFSVADAQAKLLEWQRDYNEVRPRSSLGQIPPREFAAGQLTRTARGAILNLETGLVFRVRSLPGGTHPKLLRMSRALGSTPPRSQVGVRGHVRRPLAAEGGVCPAYAPSGAAGISTMEAGPFALSSTMSRRAWKGPSVARWPMLNTIVSGSRSRTSR